MHCYQLTENRYLRVRTMTAIHVPVVIVYFLNRLSNFYQCLQRHRHKLTHIYAMPLCDPLSLENKLTNWYSWHVSTPTRRTFFSFLSANSLLWKYTSLKMERHHKMNDNSELLPRTQGASFVSTKLWDLFQVVI